MTGPDTKDPRPEGTDADAAPRPVAETVTDRAPPTPPCQPTTDGVEEAEVVAVTPRDGAATGDTSDTATVQGDAARADEPGASPDTATVTATGDAPLAHDADAAPGDAGNRAEPGRDAADAASADLGPLDPGPVDPQSVETPAHPSPQPAPVPPAAKAAEAPPRRGGSGFVALLLGGVIAAGAGFALARFVPDGWPNAQPGTDPAIADRIDGLASRVATLADRIAAVEGQLRGGDGAEVAALSDEVAALRAAIAALPSGGATSGDVSAEIAALRAELAALRAGADGAAVPDVAALAAEVAALRAQVEAGPDAALAEQIAALTAAAEAERAAAAARAEALRLEAERATAAMRARAAVLRLQAAIDAGGPLDAALADLAAAGVAVPPALAERAAGVPTLAMLQAAFPEAARAALAASATVPPEGGLGERLIAFLRAQTGARSLTPREGDDPDAVLSRAEAALRAGDLAAVLAALDALPETAKPALAAWRAQAEARAAAVAAAADLAATLAGE